MKKTRQVIFFITAVLIVQVTFGQVSKNKLDIKYFLLGTLNDYMGRQKFKNQKPSIDFYFPYEKKFGAYMDSLISEQFKDVKLEVDSQGFTSLYSPTLSKEIEKYYIYYPSGAMTIVHDTIYQGKLKYEIFENDFERISFIIGAYVRFGLQNDTVYHISIANSLSKITLCQDLLLKFKCNDVKYEIVEGIPYGHELYFRPTETIEQYLKEYNYLMTNE